LLWSFPRRSSHTQGIEALRNPALAIAAIITNYYDMVGENARILTILSHQPLSDPLMARTQEELYRDPSVNQVLF